MQKSPKYRIIGSVGEYFKCRGINVAKLIHIHRDTLKPFEVRGNCFTIARPTSWESGAASVTMMPWGKTSPVELEDCRACTDGFKAHLELPNVVCPYCWGGGKRIKSPINAHR